MTNGLHDVELLSMEIHVVFNKKIEKKVNNYKLKKKNMYVNNYFDIFVFLLFLIIFLHETIKNNKEKEEYKKLVNVLKEEVSFLREEVNKINNKNIKLETNIFNTNKDLEEKINKRFRKVNEFNLDFNLKYPLFLNSLKFLIYFYNKKIVNYYLVLLNLKGSILKKIIGGMMMLKNY